MHANAPRPSAIASILLRPQPQADPKGSWQQLSRRALCARIRSFIRPRRGTLLFNFLCSPARAGAAGTPRHASPQPPPPPVNFRRAFDRYLSVFVGIISIISMGRWSLNVLHLVQTFPSYPYHKPSNSSRSAKMFRQRIIAHSYNNPRNPWFYPAQVSVLRLKPGHA